MILDAATDAALRQAGRRAKRYAALLVGFILLVALITAFALGWHKGEQSMQADVAELSQKLGTETERAAAAEGALESIKATLQRERERRAHMQRIAEQELAALANRVAALSAAAEAFQNDIRKKASTDEECIALRDLPVCGAVADGLWGRPPTADPH